MAKAGTPNPINYVALLGQDTMWVPGDGVPVKIADLARSHLFSILASLERRAGRFAASYVKEVYSAGWQNAPAEVLASVDLAILDSTLWMRSQPLYVALLKEVNRED
jgi:hypothetical protein